MKRPLILLGVVLIIFPVVVAVPAIFSRTPEIEAWFDVVNETSAPIHYEIVEKDTGMTLVTDDVAAGQSNIDFVPRRHSKANPERLQRFPDDYKARITGREQTFDVELDKTHLEKNERLLIVVHEGDAKVFRLKR